MKARVPRGKSGRTALCGMLAAVSLALLWVAGMAPSGRLGLSALAGLGPVVAVLTAGRGAGYLCWAASGVLGLLLTPAYRKAARLRPEFDRTVKGCLEELAALERENCPSMDRAADTFARLLQSAAPVDDPRHRVLEQLLYHLGRWIYLIDARDDLAEDLADGRYNPVAARFGPEGDDGLLKQTLDASLDRMGAAFQLGEFGCRTALLENLIYLGLPLVQRAVFDGSWAEIKKQKIWSRGQ